MRTPTHTAAELIQLRQTKGVCPVDDHGIDRGNIQTILDDRGCHQHICASGDELVHDFFQRALGKLSVSDQNSKLGAQPLDVSRHALDGMHPVVNKEGLSSSVRLAKQRLPDQIAVELADLSVDRHPALGWGLDHGDIANSKQRKIQGAGNRGGGQGQHIHVGFELFDLFLVPHPKPLFLVHDQKSKILEDYGLTKKGMGSHHHVQATVLDSLQNCLFFLGISKPRQHLHLDRKTGKALLEGVEVLFSEDGGGDKHRNLFSILDGLERRANRHLGFSKADIPADEVIHRGRFFHIQLDPLHRLPLIGCLFIGKGPLEFPLPGSVGRESMSGICFAVGIEPDQFSGHLLDRAFGPALGLVPALPPQTREPRVFPLFAGVLLDQIQLIHGDIEFVIPLIGQFQDIGHVSVDLEPGEPDILTDPVIDVDHVCSRFQGSQFLEPEPRSEPGGARTTPGTAKEFVIGQHRQVCPVDHEPRGDHADFQSNNDFFLHQQFLQPRSLTLIVTKDGDVVPAIQQSQ